MKALDEYFLMAVFTLLLKRVNGFADFVCYGSLSPTSGTKPKGVTIQMKANEYFLMAVFTLFTVLQICLLWEFIANIRLEY